MALFIFAVATAALRMHAFALGALERPPLPRGMAASMLEQGPERPTAALVPPPRRLTDLLELEAKGVPQKQGSLFTGRTRRVVRRVLGYIWPKGDWKGKFLICVSMLALCFAKWLNILVPFALKRAVDALEAQQSTLGASGAAVVMSVGGPLLGAYVAARLGVSLANEARSVAFAGVLQTAARRFSLDLFDALHRGDAAFHLANPTGALSTSFARAVRGMQSLLFQLLYSIFPTLLEVGLSATVLTRRFSSVGRALTAVTLGTFAVYFAWTALLVEWRIQLRARLNALDSAKGAYFVDSLAGQEAIKLYGNEAAEEQRFDGILRSIATTSLRSALVGSMLNAGQALIFAAGLLGSLLLAAQGFGRGQLSLGDVVAINALLLQLSRPMEFIGYTVSEVRQSLADMDAMARLLLLPDTPTAVRPSVGPADAPPSDVNSLPLTPPEVRFEGVSYRYPNASVPALDHVSFVAPAGGTTVLVGTSGSGKSTALRLLARLRDADSGTVNAWGRDVRGVTGAALRQRIGFVTQEPTLFDDTVLYNIRFGAFEAPVERSRAAAAAAALDGSLARWPQGLETRVGERGAQLSGGERQRVTVARALLREPPLLLADEATSAADALTEAELITALRAVRCTLITAAHRLSAITPNADHVVVFKAGRVAEQGTHTALLAQDGEYRRLWRTQEQER